MFGFENEVEGGFGKLCGGVVVDRTMLMTIGSDYSATAEGRGFMFYSGACALPFSVT